MTKDEYVKRLEEIMAKYAIQIMGTYQGATSLGVDGFNAISAIQQLNNEAIGADIEIDYSFGVGDDRPDIQNEVRQELRNIIGKEI